MSGVRVEAKGSGYDFIYLLSTLILMLLPSDARSSLKQVNGRLGAACGEIVIVFIIVLLLLSSANPAFEFSTASGILMTGVAQETETSLDDSAPAEVT